GHEELHAFKEGDPLQWLAIVAATWLPCNGILIVVILYTSIYFFILEGEEIFTISGEWVFGMYIDPFTRVSAVAGRVRLAESMYAGNVWFCCKDIGNVGIQWENILYFGFFCWLACIKQDMLEPEKVKCIFLTYRKDMDDYQLWRYELVQVLQGVAFEVESLGIIHLRWNLKGNVNKGVGLQEVQTRNLIYYQLACDMEHHSAREPFRKSSDDNDDYYCEYTPVSLEVMMLHMMDLLTPEEAKYMILAEAKSLAKGTLDRVGS
ncbi:hypothetical protein Tco_0419071, partial [Tanacetum coccineum]